MKTKRKIAILMAALALTVGGSTIGVSAMHSHPSIDKICTIEGGMMVTNSGYKTKDFELFNINYGRGYIGCQPGGVLSADTVTVESTGLENAKRCGATAQAYKGTMADVIGATKATAVQKGKLWIAAKPGGHACTTLGQPGKIEVISVI